MRNFPGIPILPLLICLASLFLYPSCSLFRLRDPYAVSLPESEIPVSRGQPPLFWEISWLDGSGGVKSRRMEIHQSFVLELPRERPVVVCGRPEYGFPDFRIRPAGFLSSRIEDPNEGFTLNWFDGFAADYLLNIARKGLDPGTLNIDRFRDAVRSRCTGNPWYTDTRRLSADLTESELWIYSFRPKDLYPIHLPLTPGEWYAAYPPFPVFQAGDSGWSGELPPGFHKLFNPAASRVCSLSVDSEGRMEWVVN